MPIARARMTRLRCKPASCALRRSCALSVECRSLWYPRVFRALNAARPSASSGEYSSSVEHPSLTSQVVSAAAPPLVEGPPSSSALDEAALAAASSPSSSSFFSFFFSSFSSSSSSDAKTSVNAAADGCGVGFAVSLRGLIFRRFLLTGAPAIFCSCSSSFAFLSSSVIVLALASAACSPSPSPRAPPPCASSLYRCCQRQS
mmetsp:Transcript_13383/g.48001  ORF Transcript_13383/g.48001 Transcript_13383/m.48001 type:complete len:202 (-) Transcript_13383:474-1079(-)